MKRVTKDGDKVKSPADHEGNYDLEMNGDDGIGPDLPLTDLAENRNGHIGQWRLYWDIGGKHFSFVFLCSDLFEAEMEREDEEGRLEQRIPAPWDKQHPPGAASQLERKKTKKEERNRRRSMKVHSKDKIGNIDINVLQRELCGSHSLTPPFCHYNRTDDDISSARRRHL